MENKKKAWASWIGTTVSASMFGVAYGAVALFYDTILQNTGCSGAAYGLIFTLIGIGMALSGTVAGKLLEMNNKLFSVIGALSGILLYGSLYFAKNIFIIYAFAFLFGVMFNLCGATYYSIATAKWFNVGRAKILSFGFSIANGASIIFNPLYASIVMSVGGPVAALIVGALTSGISMIMLGIIVPRFPQYYGLAPYDWGKAPSGGDSAQMQAAGFETSLPLSKIVMSPAFLMVFFSVFFISGGTNIYFTNSVMLFQSFGLEYTQATLGTSIAAAAALVLSPISGFIIDRFGVKVGIVSYASVGAVVCFLTPFLHGWTGMIIFALLINCCQIYMMVGATAIPKLFGVQKSGQLIGWVQMAASISSMIFAPVSTGVYTMTSSYVAPFLVAGVGIVLAIIMTLVALSDKMEANIKMADERYLNSLK